MPPTVAVLLHSWPQPGDLAGVPAVYVRSSEDVGHAPERADRFVARLPPGVPVLTVPGGHDCMISRPDELAAVLDDEPPDYVFAAVAEELMKLPGVALAVSSTALREGRAPELLARARDHLREGAVPLQDPEPAERRRVSVRRAAQVSPGREPWEKKGLPPC